jgi:hypothetical protein
MSSSPGTAIPSDAYNSESISSLPIAFTAVFLPFVLLFVGLRFYTRHMKGTAWGFDDVLVLIAALGQIGLAAISLGMFLVLLVTALTSDGGTKLS